MTKDGETRSDTLAVEGWRERPHAGIYTMLLLVSMGLLTLEISLTRLFSYTVWYHLAYLTISVALLGFGASGAIVAAFPRLFQRNGESRIIGLIVVAAGFTTLQLLIVVRHPLEISLLLTSPLKFSLGLLAYYLAVGIPFLLAGFAISASFGAYPRLMGRLYFFDLFGAALGCLAVVWFIEQFGVPGLVLAAAAMMLAGAAALGLGGGHRAVGAVLAVASLVVLVRAPTWGESLDVFITASKLDVRMDPRAPTGPGVPARTLDGYRAELERGAAYSRWTALNRVDAVGWEHPSKYQYWGQVGNVHDYRGPLPDTAQLTYDGSNGSAIYSFNGSFDDFAMLDRHLLHTPYALKERPNVLVIGVGGGIDMMNAIKHGASHVTGVELQPKTVQLLKDRLRTFTGGFYDRRDVTLVAGEGRHFVRQTDQTFDVIEITAVDTFSAQATGAYVLAESYLYTVEAFDDYLTRLRPGGIVSLVIGGFVYSDALPPYATRLALNGYRALQRAGVAHPENQLLVVASRAADGVTEAQDIIVKQSPFTAQEIATVKAFASANGHAVLYAPAALAPGSYQLAEVLGPDEAVRQRVIDSEWFRVDAVYDDDPFLYNVGKWANFSRQKDLGSLMPGSFVGQIVLLLMIGQALVLACVLIPVPLLFGARAGLKARGVLSYLAYFLSLGIGFMFVEISFVQTFVLFLGSPTYALSVTIFSLLLFSSLGSFLSGRFVDRPNSALPRLAVAVVVLIAAYSLGLSAVFDAFLHLDILPRILIAIAAQMPIGLALGMFMPLGIACLSRNRPRLVPWAWGINGIGSVIGTTMAVVLAMSWGFTVVKVCAALLYVTGVALMVRQQRAELVGGPSDLEREWAA